MSDRICKWCGYPHQPGQAIHADCATKRIAALEDLGSELIGAVGISLPVGDAERTRLIHKARATLWPKQWRLNEAGEAVSTTSAIQ